MVQVSENIVCSKLKHSRAPPFYELPSCATDQGTQTLTTAGHGTRTYRGLTTAGHGSRRRASSISSPHMQVTSQPR